MRNLVSGRCSHIAKTLLMPLCAVLFSTRPVHAESIQLTPSITFEDARSHRELRGPFLAEIAAEMPTKCVRAIHSNPDIGRVSLGFHRFGKSLTFYVPEDVFASKEDLGHALSLVSEISEIQCDQSFGDDLRHLYKKDPITTNLLISLVANGNLVILILNDESVPNNQIIVNDFLFAYRTLVSRYAISAIAPQLVPEVEFILKAFTPYAIQCSQEHDQPSSGSDSLPG